MSESPWQMETIYDVCPKCKGKGVVLMCVEYTDTLAEVIRAPGVAAVELVDRFPRVGATALNNRLEHLRKAGFLRRERDGKKWKYWPLLIKEKGINAAAE